MDFVPSLSIDLLIRARYGDAPAPPVREERPLYRVLHDRELPGGVRQIVKDRGVPLPEVFQLKPVHFTPLTRALQILWKDCNLLLTSGEWRKLAGCHRFATNNYGFDCSEGKHGPFADFVNGRDLGAALPKIESIICGGAIVSGVETVYQGVPSLQLDTINPDAVPDAADLPRWLKYEAVSVRPDGGVQSFSISPHPEYVPLISSVPVYYPLSGLVRVAGEVANG